MGHTLVSFHRATGFGVQSAVCLMAALLCACSLQRTCCTQQASWLVTPMLRAVAACLVTAGGIIGALNNGRGITGVAPGTPLFALKVLDGAGQGSLSAVMDAVKWAAGPAGRVRGIEVINLSIASYMDPQSPDYATTLQYFCAVLKEASDAGVVLVASAGNYASLIYGYMPASCPTVAAVTALDVRRNEPAAFSSFLPDTAPADDKTRLFSAPGTAVLSTMSTAQAAVDPKYPYRELSGTSQAAPHVSGVAVACIMSGACSAGKTGMQKLALVQAAAKERLAMPKPQRAYGFSAAKGKFYGNLVWAGKYISTGY